MLRQLEVQLSRYLGGAGNGTVAPSSWESCFRTQDCQTDGTPVMGASAVTFAHLYSRAAPPHGREGGKNEGREGTLTGII